MHLFDDRWSLVDASTTLSGWGDDSVLGHVYRGGILTPVYIQSIPEFR